LDTAILLVSNTPGYLMPKAKCKRTLQQHLAYLNQEDKELQDIEVGLEDAVARARSLLVTQESLVNLARRLHRLKVLHMVVRTAAISTLPFVPVLSAALTAADTLGFTVYIGLHKSVATEDELQEALGEVKSKVEALEETMAGIRDARHWLSVLQERTEKQREEPAMHRLLDLLRMLHHARDLVEPVLGSFDGQSGADAPEASMWDLVSAMRDLIAALDVSEEAVTSINLQECDTLANITVAFRSSTAASVSV
ncbi:hypothetical protein C8Q78DRAFT_980308, partial [Trametes maxima]